VHTQISLPDAKASLYRTDIQWLRALAVSLVVVYHLWPGRLTGGYVGVDIFFVISGFLITSGLVKRPPQSWRDVAEFWGRRIRRLLPASFLVIIASCIAAWLLGPPSAWVQTARDAVAAAMYAENWNLWHKSTDYLSQSGQPSIFQHFWSLSVEEQFYVFWPLMILAMAMLRRRSDHARDAVASPRRIIAWAVGACAVISFSLSVWMTTRDEAEAYLVTQTRVWELALGGLLACFWPELQARLKFRAGIRAIFATLGLIAMVASAVLFTDATAFPGWVALLPTVGAALFISGGHDPAYGHARAQVRASDSATATAADAGAPVSAIGHHASGEPKPHGKSDTLSADVLAPLWSFRPAQYLGDMSYSVYLWHWPMILLVSHISQRRLGAIAATVVILATLGISAASYEFVERPFQRSEWLRGRLRRTFVPAVAAMTAVCAIGSALYVGVPIVAEGPVNVARAQARQNECAGAQQLLNPACYHAGTANKAKPLLSPKLASFDGPSVYGDGCVRASTGALSVSCRYGLPRESARSEIVLWGNSHAAQWFPAIELIADEQHLGVTTMLSKGCFPLAPGDRYASLQSNKDCVDVTLEELDTIRALRPDLVILANRAEADPEMYDTAVESAKLVLTQLAEAGTKVLLIRDNPRQPEGESIPDCLVLNADHLSRCSGSREDWTFPDPWADAAVSLAQNSVVVLDLTEGICDGATCHGVVGGIIAYTDHHHLTATFVETLAPQLSAAVSDLLSR
jgi:peptidoglycan/LPS O-acetylase OafA/YrhL